MPKTELITAKKLVTEGACGKPLATFRKEWPEGARVTLKNLRRALELKLDIEWFASRFLKAPLWKEHDEKRALIIHRLWRKQCRSISQ